MINEIELTQAKWSIKAAVRMAENEKELIEIGGYICRTMAERVLKKKEEIQKIAQ